MAYFPSNVTQQQLDYAQKRNYAANRQEIARNGGVVPKGMSQAQARGTDIYEAYAVQKANEKADTSRGNGSGGGYTAPTPDYNSYYNELQSYLDEMTARNEELAKAQEAQRQKQISDNTEESRRRLQSAYNTQRRDIIRSSGNMSGAKVAGLTNAGNTYNNNVTELNNNADQLRTTSNIEYLGALAEIANNKYKNKYNLLLNSPYYAN